MHAFEANPHDFGPQGGCVSYLQWSACLCLEGEQKEKHDVSIVVASVSTIMLLYTYVCRCVCTLSPSLWELSTVCHFPSHHRRGFPQTQGGDFFFFFVVELLQLQNDFNSTLTQNVWWLRNAVPLDFPFPLGYTAGEQLKKSLTFKRSISAHHCRKLATTKSRGAETESILQT